MLVYEDLFFGTRVGVGAGSDRVRTSKVDFSRLLKSMRMVIWKVDTCSMCFLVLEPVTWAPPTTTSEPSSWGESEDGRGCVKATVRSTPIPIHRGLQVASLK